MPQQHLLSRVKEYLGWLARPTALFPNYLHHRNAGPATGDGDGPMSAHKTCIMHSGLRRRRADGK